MYNDELKVWEGENIDEKKLEWYRSAANDPTAQYYLADNLLSKYQKGYDAAEAVWLMEKSANADHIPSVLAMAQMFRYGWAVKKSIPTAVKWYQKAAELGSADAVSALRELESSDKEDDKETEKRTAKGNNNKGTRQPDNGAKKKKKRRVLPIVTVCIAAAAVVAAVALLIIFRGSAAAVKVGDNTELKRTVSADDFEERLNELKNQYDDEQVISGERPTNRIMLRFEGSKLDLSDFPADKVIWREDNRVVIQFKNEEDARHCMEALKQLDGVQYIEEDTYQNFTDSGVTAPTTGQEYNEQYISNYSGYTYYSWGVIDLGLDCLDAWLNENYTDNSVTVAVVDSGVVPNAETEDRILPGYDCVIGGDGTDAVNGHGTHVAGIVLDATQGLNVNILPVRVIQYSIGNTLTILNGIEYAAEHGADVINLSLSGFASAEYDYVVKKVIKEGVTVVAAAGNKSDDTANYSPSRIMDCIVVSAYDANHNIADFSNYGDSVSVAAPGVDILSYWKDDSDVSEILRDMDWQKQDDGLRGTNVLDNGIHVEFENGTSMAAPHITALAAMVKLIVPDASPEQVKKYIQDYCVDMGNREYFGAGICQAQFMAGN